jgi:hypothetical protein
MRVYFAEKSAAMPLSDEGKANLSTSDIQNLGKTGQCDPQRSQN